ncbi:MAG: prepilin peptidase, partial [Candidatus Paceibacterota bacterium]
MDITALVLFFIFGTIIGSFLNVVALRFNTGATLGGRSKCMSCGHQLTWKELIPVLSFLWQGGLCRNCRSRISRQYVLVELSTGLLFALILQDVVGASGPEFLATIIALIS